MLALTLLAAVPWTVEVSSLPPHALNLELSLAPPVGQIRPDRTDRPVRVTVRATCPDRGATGSAVAGAEVRVVLDAPPAGGLLTTDFPIVEGTRLLELAGRTDAEGALSFEYVFPIRGRYRLTAETVSGNGSTVVKAVEIDVAENGEEWAYLLLLLGGLFALGLAAGRVFGRSHRAARAAAAAVAGPAAAILAMLAAPVPGGAPAYGHDHGHNGHDDGPVKARTVTRGPLTLEYALELPADRDRPRVGEPAVFHLALRSSVPSAAPAEFEVSLVNAEENEAVFKTVLRAGPDGRARFAYQFWDGADHELRVTARAGEAAAALSSASDDKVGSGEPVMIPVEAIEPPTPVVIKSLTLMLLVCAAGLALGFALGARG